MTTPSNDHDDLAAGLRARLEQAREKRGRRQTRDTQRLHQLRHDLELLAIYGHENLTRPLDAGRVLSRMLGCLEDRNHYDPGVVDIRDTVVIALLEHGRRAFDEHYGPKDLAFGQDPLRAQLDQIRATLESAVLRNDLGGVALALVMLDHVDGDPGRREAESSAPAQAAV